MGCKIKLAPANKAGKDGLQTLLIPTEEIYGRYSAYDLINEATGEIYVEAGDEIARIADALGLGWRAALRSDLSGRARVVEIRRGG